VAGHEVGAVDRSRVGPALGSEQHLRRRLPVRAPRNACRGAGDVGDLHVGDDRAGVLREHVPFTPRPQHRVQPVGLLLAGHKSANGDDGADRWRQSVLRQQHPEIVLPGAFAEDEAVGGCRHHDTGDLHKQADRIQPCAADHPLLACSGGTVVCEVAAVQCPQVHHVGLQRAGAHLLQLRCLQDALAVHVGRKRANKADALALERGHVRHANAAGAVKRLDIHPVVEQSRNGKSLAAAKFHFLTVREQFGLRHRRRARPERLVDKRVNASAVAVEDVQLVLAIDRLAHEPNGAVGRPGVLIHPHLAPVRTHDLLQPVAFLPRVIRLDIDESGWHGGRELGGEVQLRDGAVQHRVQAEVHGGHGAVAVVQRIRIVVHVRDVVGQEVRLVVVRRIVHAHGVREFVDLHAVNERQAWIAKAIHVLERGAVFHEAPLQSAGHHPARYGGLPRVQIPQVHRQRWRDLVRVDLRADDL